LKILEIPINKVIPYENNPRLNDDAVEKVAESIKQFGFNQPIVLDKNNIIIVGHTRLKAAKLLALKKVPVLYANDLTEEKIKAYRLADNKVSEFSSWDNEKLTAELLDLQNYDLDFELSDFGLDLSLDDIKNDDLNFDITENQENNETEDSISDEVPQVQTGDVYRLGKHRLMCGDCTNKSDVKKLMNGKKAVLAHNDPPYGMKKEIKGVKNDNLNYEDLLKFNKKWFDIQYQHLESNGSFYVWGIDVPLMDFFAEIFKPLIKAEKITFRNLITWDKGSGQGQNSPDFRQYPVADEKCLFFVNGITGFNTNKDYFFEGFSPIFDYLLESRNKMGWSVKDMKTAVGHSDKSRDHWTSKSQWELITEENYIKMQKAAKTAGKKAFEKPYAELKKEYETANKEFLSTRAYFNNTHDNMNNVWHFKRAGLDEREQAGGHATPKPLDLCGRVINSSSQENDLVIDFFGGSGSTLIACEQLNRICFMMEIDVDYCKNIIKRWETLTGLKAEKI
jgi:DNA modification methylase